MENDRNNPRVPCPRCRTVGNWFTGRWAPFCSERCKLIDLGQWFSEEHKVSRPLAPNDFEGFDELPPGPELDQVRE